MNNQPLRYSSPIGVEGLLPKDSDTQAHQRALWTRAICVQIQWLLLPFLLASGSFLLGGGDVLLVDGQHISHFNRCSVWEKGHCLLTPRSSSGCEEQ